MAFEGDVATVTESADLLVSKRPATRLSAWTSGNTQSTRISFEAVHDQHPPTAKAEVNPGSQSYPRSLNHAGNVPLQCLEVRAFLASELRIHSAPRLSVRTEVRAPTPTPAQ